MFKHCFTPILTLLVLLSLMGCGSNEQAATASDTISANTASESEPETPKAEKKDYATTLSHVIRDGILAQCEGLQEADVLAFHHKRNEGLDGTILTGDDMKLLDCDYQVRLLADGEKEFQGL